jgi:hypothetical protein
MTVVLTSVSPMPALNNDPASGAQHDDLGSARGVVFATMLSLGFWGMLLTAVLA